MSHEQLNVLSEKLSECWNAIDSATDKAIIKILDYYGLDIDYVRTYPDEFTLYEKSTYTLYDFIKHYDLVYGVNTLGSFTLHLHLDMDKQQIQTQLIYTLGGDS